MLIGILLTLNEKSRVLKINMCNLKTQLKKSTHDFFITIPIHGKS